MKGVSRALRLDEFRWYWLESEATRAGSSAMVLGTFLVLAFNRFGWPDFAPRATVRFLLLGFYGWLGLSLAVFVIVLLTHRRTGSPLTLLLLFGHAHLPLFLVAIFMQVVSVSLDVAGVSRWPALFAGVFWMPAMLAAAVHAWTDVRRYQAALSVVVPHFVWTATLGRHLWDQLDHLL